MPAIFKNSSVTGFRHRIRISTSIGQSRTIKLRYRSSGSRPISRWCVFFTTFSGGIAHKTRTAAFDITSGVTGFGVIMDVTVNAGESKVRGPESASLLKVWHTHTLSKKRFRHRWWVESMKQGQTSTFDLLDKVPFALQLTRGQIAWFTNRKHVLRGGFESSSLEPGHM